MSTKRAFLGGTCNNSTWREDLIRLLQIDFFNPVIDDWNEEAQEREIHERETCDFCVYVLTPRMTGTFAVAEVVDDSNKRPEKTVFCVLGTDGLLSFDQTQLKSWTQVGLLVERNGGKVLNSLEEVADYLNEEA